MDRETGGAVLDRKRDSQDVEGASSLCKILNIPLIDVSWEPSRLPIQVISFRRKTQLKTN